MIHFREEGNGQAVILLHGFCENHSLWEGVSDSLQSGYHVYRPDLPGHGKSDLPAQVNTLDHVADLLLRWIDQLHIDRFIVIGHSLGGYIALSMLNKYPDRVQGLGLFHSTALADSPEKKANRLKTFAFVKKHGDAVFKKTFIPSLYHHSVTSPQLLSQMVNHTPTETILRYTRMMRDRPDQLAMLAAACKPTLIVAGVHDTFIPLSTLEDQAATIGPSAVLYRLHETGHLGMWEQPEASENILKQFLLSV